MGCSGSKNAAANTAPADKAQQPLEGNFKVSLERTSDDQTVGLSLTVLDAGVMVIEGVKDEGLVPEFIKNNPDAADQHVKQGDRIIAVNGVGKDSEKMKEEFKAKTIVLTLQRQEQQAATPAQATEVVPAQAEPAAEPATTEGPAAATTADGPANEAPVVQGPAEEAPPAQVAGSEGPAADAPAADAPAAEGPAAEVPAAGAPADEAPVVQGSAQEAPAEAKAAAEPKAEEVPVVETAEAAAAPADVPASTTEAAAAAAPPPTEEGGLQGVDLAELLADANAEEDERLCKLSMC